jgi:hypothetical protein
MPSASWDVLLVRMVPVKYETPRCIFDCWLPKIHKVNADSSPTASASVQQRVRVYVNTMFLCGCMLSRVGMYCLYVWFPWSTKLHIVDLIAGYIKYTRLTRKAHPQQVHRFNNLVGYSLPLLCRWLHAGMSWGVLSVRMVPVKYEVSPCRFDCWLHTIHKLDTDSIFKASAAVQQLAWEQFYTIMYVVACCRELGCTFGTYGSRAVWNSTL